MKRISDKSLIIRMPERLYNTLCKEAGRRCMPVSTFARSLLVESAASGAQQAGPAHVEPAPARQAEGVK